MSSRSSETVHRGRPDFEVDTVRRRGMVAAIVDDCFRQLEAPQSIGRYVVEKRIGEGAFGVVYAAYDPKLDRKVAIKLLQPLKERGEDARRAQLRLRHEARALARFSHPNIVSVFDTGLHVRSGDPPNIYVVMELVEGMTLGRWLTTPRSWQEILRVYLQAARGLTAAHDAGLVHGDFKPANVLLDETGCLRVADFGLARSLMPSMSPDDLGLPTDHGTSTTLSQGRESLDATGCIAGTPAYMAPEQHIGVRGDASSDQYSFCVALYEGVYGLRPFRGATLHELATRKATGRAGRPPAGRAVPRWLHRTLLRGLSSDPADRFPSMRALVSVLEAGGSGRRRLLIPLAVAVAGVATTMATRAEEPGGLCADEGVGTRGIWNDGVRARLEDRFVRSGRNYATQMWHEMAGHIDGYVGAWNEVRQETCGSLRATDEAGTNEFELRAACLEERRSELTAVLEVLGDVTSADVADAHQALTTMGSVEHCRDTRALGRKLALPADPQTRRAVLELEERANVVSARFRVGQYARALAEAKALCDDAEAIGYEPMKASAFLVLGFVQTKTSDYEAAAANLEQAAWLADGVNANNLAAQAKVALIAVVGERLSRPEEGLAWSEHARSSILRLEDQDALEGTRLSSTAVVLSRLGKHEEGLQYALDAVKLRARALGSEHPDVGLSWLNVSVTQARLARWQDAYDSAARGLPIVEASVGPDHPHVYKFLNNMAVAAKNMGQYDRARQHFERSIELLDGFAEPEDPRAVSQRARLAAVYIEAGALAKARPLLDGALAACEQSKCKGTRIHASTLDTVGELARAEGDLDRALDAYQQAIGVRETDVGVAPNDSKLVIAMSSVGELILERGDAPRAVAVLKRAHERAVESKHPLDRPTVERALARALWRIGEREQARALAQEAIDRYGAAGDFYEAERARLTDWLRKHPARQAGRENVAAAATVQ